MAMSDDEVNEFLENLYTAELEPTKTLPTVLDLLLTKVDNKVARGDFECLDLILKYFCPSSTRRIVAICLIRITYKYRDVLPSWEPCLQKIVEYYKYNSTYILRGL